MAAGGATGAVAGLAVAAGVATGAAGPVALLLAGAGAGLLVLPAGVAVAMAGVAGAAVAGSGLVCPRLAAGVLPRSGVAGEGVAIAGVLAAAGALLSGSCAMTKVGSEAASLLMIRPELTGTLAGVVSGFLPDRLSSTGMAARAMATRPAAMARRFFSSGVMAVAESEVVRGSEEGGFIAD